MPFWNTENSSFIPSTHQQKISFSISCLVYFLPLFWEFIFEYCFGLFRVLPPNYTLLSHFIEQVDFLTVSGACYYFIFTECALVYMVMLLRCYAYAKNNSNNKTVCNTDDMLSTHGCVVLLYFVL